MDHKNSILKEIAEKESNFGKIFKVNGPLVVAEQMTGARMHEMVKIGWNKLSGEIIKLEGDTASIQCYEDTQCLTVGDPVMKTREPLSVELGPGLLAEIFDGIQRPLQSIAQASRSVFIPKGVDVPALDPIRLWHFVPKKNVKVDSCLTGGDIYGTVHENNLFSEHNIMIPPKSKGKVNFIAPEGQYNIHEKILELEYDGKKTEYSMSHFWPVRQARPYHDKLNVQQYKSNQIKKLVKY